MKKFSKKLVSIITAAVVASGFITPITTEAATSTFYKVDNSSFDDTAEKAQGEAVEIDGKYATNPSGQVGKEASITIDGDFSDWSEDMCIAQGMANDSPVKFKGDWENCVIDSYSLYAAWDDNNLYVGWQNVNTADICNGQGGALSEGKLSDLPQFIAIDTGKGNQMTGRCADGKGIWGNDITFETPVTHVAVMHANATGTPGFFTAGEDGLTDYKAHCGDFEDLGIEFGTSFGCLPSKLMGIYQIPGSPEGVEMLYDSTQPVDLLTQGTHDKAQDQFFELKIPFSALGITKDDLLTNGVGIMQLGTRGESALDCLPHDKCMLDNVFGDYAKEPSNTHEKDDADIITVPLAKAGKGGVVVVKPKFTSFDSSVASPQEAGTSIKFDAQATSENGAVTYEYKVDGTTVQDYSSNGSFTWTPSNAGTYKVTVTAKDTSGKTTSKDMSYVITAPPVDGPKISSFTPNLTSPQSVGSNITFTTTATGTGLSYKYYVDGSLEDSGSNKFVWSPTSEGTYTVMVEVSDTNGNKVTKSVSYVINKVVNNFKVTEINASKASSQAYVGDSITLSTTSSGGVGSVNYRFRVRLNGTLTDQSTISTAKTFAWKPTEAGTYTIEVFAQDDDSNTNTKTINYVVKAAPTTLKFTSFATNVASPQKAGTSITMAAAATGSGTIKYKFQVYAGTTLKAQSAVGTTKTYTWKPTVAGTYTIKALAQDSTGKVITTSKSYTITNPLKFTSFATNVASPQKAGTSITMAAAATGSGTIKYKFQVYAGTTLKAQSAVGTTKTYTWKPTVAGTYTIKALAQDSTGKVITTSKSYTITNPEPIVINSLITNVAAPQNAGTSIAINTKATGKTALQYQYWIYNVDGSWTKLRAYSTTSTATWKPSVAGNYIIWVDVKDTNGNVKSKYINYKVNEKVTTLDSSSTSITCSGAWTTVSSTSYGGGSLKNANSTAKAAFTFTGTGIKMYSLTGTNKGMAKVTIDGSSFLVDLYSQTAANKKLVLSKTGLTNAKHTITIEYTGFSNINSTGTAVNFDYFELLG